MGVYYGSLQEDYIYKFEGYDYISFAIDNNDNIWMTSYYNKEISVWFNEQNDLITGLIGTMTSDSIGKQLFVSKHTIHDINSKYLSFDNSNNLYITDHSNQVWKINNTGTKTIKIAGNGEDGWNGDANSLSIQMNNPMYVVIDASYNVYIPDNDNHVIRQLFDVDGSMNILGGTDITGVTGDGGDAREARIDDQNYAVTLDSCGNIFFSGNDDQIRMIFSGTTTPLITSLVGNLTSDDTNKIYTVAGVLNAEAFAGDGGLATLARFRNIIDITFDLSGNLLICDYTNHRVRKIDQQGIVSTIAGTGGASYTGPGNPTLHNLYYPRGIVVDSYGNIFIADHVNERIRYIYNGGDLFGLNHQVGWIYTAIITTKRPNKICIDNYGDILYTTNHDQVFRLKRSDASVELVAGIYNSSTSR